MAVVALHFGDLVCHVCDVSFGVAQFGFMLASESLKLVYYYLLLFYDCLTLIQCHCHGCRGLVGSRGFPRLRYHARAVTCLSQGRRVSINKYRYLPPLPPQSPPLLPPPAPPLPSPRLCCGRTGFDTSSWLEPPLLRLAHAVLPR